MREPSRRVQFLGDLAAMVDEDSEAQEQHRPLLEQNPAAAQLHHEVCAIAAEIGMAGSDFAPSIDFRRKLDEELRARRAGRPHRADSREHTLPMLPLPEASTHHRPPLIDSARADTQEIEVIRLDSAGLPIPSSAPEALAVSSAPAPPDAPPPTLSKWPRPLALALAPPLVVAALWFTGLLPQLPSRGPAEPSSMATMPPPSNTSQNAPRPFSLTVIQSKLEEHQAVQTAQREPLQGVQRTDKHGAPLPWSPTLHVGEQITTNGTSLCRLQTPAGHTLTLGRNSRISIVDGGKVRLIGALRIEASPTATAEPAAIVTAHAHFESTPTHMHQLWMLHAAPLHTQVAAFSGNVSVTMPRGDVKTLHPHSEMLIPLRGVPTTQPSVDSSAWFPHFTMQAAGHGFGQLHVAGQSTPLFPESHHVHMQIGTGHALIEVSETFPSSPGESPWEYTLPLPPHATALSSAQQMGFEHIAPEAVQGAAGDGETSVIRVHLSEQAGQPTLTSRYLVALQRDSLGQHHRYDLVPPTGPVAPQVSIHVEHVDPGSLEVSASPTLAGVVAAAETQRGKSLQVSPSRGKPLHLRAFPLPALAAKNGAVRWSTWSRDADDRASIANAPLHSKLPINPPQAALFIVPPEPPHAVVTPGPRHFVIVVDRSKSVGLQWRASLEALLNQLGLESPANTRVSTLICTHRCTTGLANQELDGPASSLLRTDPTSPRGGLFSLESSVLAATTLARTYGKPPSALKSDLILITDATQSDLTSKQLQQHIGPGKALQSLTALLTGGPRRQRVFRETVGAAGGASFELSCLQEARHIAHRLAAHAYHAPLRGTQLQLSSAQPSPARFAIVPPERTGTWVPIERFASGLEQAMMSGQWDGTAVQARYTLGLAPGHPHHPPLAALFQKQAGLGLRDGPFAHRHLRAGKAPARGLATRTEPPSDLPSLATLFEALAIRTDAPIVEGDASPQPEDGTDAPALPAICSDLPMPACLEKWTARTKHDAHDKRVWLTLAALQLQSQIPASALQTLSDIADLWENDAHLHGIAGAHLLAAGETTWACAHLKRARQLEPSMYTQQAALCYATWHAAPQ